MDRELKVADMHCHFRSIETVVDGTRRKGRPFEPVSDFFVKLVKRLIKREYSPDYRLYYRLNNCLKRMHDAAGEKGFDYFAVTDHDEIEPVVQYLNENPQVEDRVIVGEEVTTELKDRGYQLHVGVYGLDEQQHLGVQRAKRDLEGELVPYLNEQELLYSLNHPFMVPWAKKNAKVTQEDMEKLRLLFPVVEKINGSISKDKNRNSQEFFRGNKSIAGSDSHNGKIGRAYTLAFAGSKEDFLDQIKKGNARIGGNGESWFNTMVEIAGKPFSYGNFVYWTDSTLKGLENLSPGDTYHGHRVVSYNGENFLRIDTKGNLRAVERFIVGFVVLTSPLWAGYHNFMDGGVEDFDCSQK